MNEIKIIKKAVEDFYHLDPGTLDRKCRERKIVLPRQVAHYLAVKLTRNSLETVGQQVGLVDHATVLHSKRKIEAFTGKDHRGRIVDPVICAAVDRLVILLNREFSSTGVEWVEHCSPYY